MGKRMAWGTAATIAACIAIGPLACGGAESASPRPTTGGTAGLAGTGGSGGGETNHCGDGIVGPGEVCDDGQGGRGSGATAPGGCALDCSGRCGDGVPQLGESCDDGNETVADGCTKCRSRGDLLWQVHVACRSSLFRGNGDTIIALCQLDGDALFHRYALDGGEIPSRVGALDDPNEAENLPMQIIETGAGDFYVSTRVRRNTVSGNPGSNSRIRIYRLAPTGVVTWMTDVSNLPGLSESPTAIALNSSGQLAIAGYDSDRGSNHALAALMSSGGQRLWKKAIESRHSSATSVAVDESGRVVAGGAVDCADDRLCSDKRDGAVWALDAIGAPLWQQVYEPANAAGGGSFVSSVAWTATDTVRLTARQMLVDQLVPNPPRTTVELWMRELAAASGLEVFSGVLSRTANDGKSWEDLKDTAGVLVQVDHPRYPLFARVGSTMSGATLDGEQKWSFAVEGALSTLLVGHLLCVTKETTAMGGVGQQLACYLLE
jgi:cysteine-rich repeat protein